MPCRIPLRRRAAALQSGCCDPDHGLLGVPAQPSRIAVLRPRRPKSLPTFRFGLCKFGLAFGFRFALFSQRIPGGKVFTICFAVLIAGRHGLFSLRVRGLICYSRKDREETSNSHSPGCGGQEHRNKFFSTGVEQSERSLVSRPFRARRVDFSTPGGSGRGDYTIFRRRLLNEALCFNQRLGCVPGRSTAAGHDAGAGSDRQHRRHRARLERCGAAGCKS